MSLIKFPDEFLLDQYKREIYITKIKNEAVF